MSIPLPVFAPGTLFHCPAHNSCLGKLILDRNYDHPPILQPVDLNLDHLQTTILLNGILAEQRRKSYGKNCKVFHPREKQQIYRYLNSLTGNEHQDFFNLIGKKLMRIYQK